MIIDAKMDLPGKSGEHPLRNQEAEDLGIGLSTLTRWVSQQRDVGERGETTVDLHAELKRLRRENAVLKQERDILKKAAAFFANEGNR